MSEVTDLTYAGAAVQAERLAAGEVSAGDLVELSLARIDATQDAIGAFRVVRHEAARAAAVEADRRLAAGERLPLLGVPVAIKDDMDLAGETTPFGCAGDHVPKREDSEIVRRLGLIGLGVLPRGTTGITEWCLDRIPNATPERRTRVEIRLGHLVGRPLLPLALRVEPRYRRLVGRVFERADVVLTPTTALPALRVGALDGRGWLASGRISATACPFAWAWNVLGWPAISVPAGFTTAGLPIGAQFLGRDCDEATLLALAAQLEAAEDWTSRTPPPAPRRSAA